MIPQEIEAAYQEVLSDRRALLAALEISGTSSERLVRVVEDATVLRLVATTEQLLREFIKAQGAKLPTDTNLSTLSDVAIRLRRQRLSEPRPTAGDRQRRQDIEPYRRWRNDYGHGVTPRAIEDSVRVKRDLARFVRGLL